MSTLVVPPVLTTPRDDAIQLHRAFKGKRSPGAHFMVRYVLAVNGKYKKNQTYSNRTRLQMKMVNSLIRQLVGACEVCELSLLGMGAGLLERSHIYGFGCDTSAVINILAYRDASQRILIQQEYRTMYSEDLTKRLSSELSGDLKKAVLLWMHDPAGRDASLVRQALGGSSIDLKAATEVLCSRTPSQLQHLRQLYHATYGVYVEHDVEYQAFDDHKKLLLAYISTPRYEGLEVDRMMAENDAKALYKAGEKRLGTDERTFRSIFCERSRAHLAAVSYAYNSMYGKSLKKAIKGETSGLFEYALLTILQCAENPAMYFAKVLRKAMKGMGTNDTTLIRVIVSRVEIDMQYIKAEYQKKYHKSLHDAVHSETSGHYKTFLLSLLGPTHH